MNKPKDKIEELFQNHINDFDRMPDDSLWESIEAELPPLGYTRNLWRWGLAAALLLFSVGGYVAYEKFGSGNTGELAGKEIKNKRGKGKSLSKEEINTPAVISRSKQAEEPTTKETKVTPKEENIRIAQLTAKAKKPVDTDRTSKVKESKEIRTSYPIVQSADRLSEGSFRSKAQGPKKSLTDKRAHEKQATNLVNDYTIAHNRPVVAGAGIGAQSDSMQSIADLRLAEVDFLTINEAVLAHGVPLHKPVAFVAEKQVIEPRESFFKAPSELYVSLTPSLNYYRVFSNTIISQFNGANNGGRLGWALQAGVVYPLKLKRLSYRLGLSYFSAQSNFKYMLNKGRQEPIRVNENTFEYGNVESQQMESKKWQVAEIQNDLLFQVRPNQQAVAGFKAGSNFSERPVFDTYLGYRFSKPVGPRQTLWLEAAYAYALNARRSSSSAFSYHMDKYSLRIGLNFR